MNYEPNIKASEVVLDPKKWYLDMTTPDSTAITGPDFYDTDDMKQGLLDGTWKQYEHFYLLPSHELRVAAMQKCVGMLEGKWIGDTFYVPAESVQSIVTSGKHPW